MACCAFTLAVHEFPLISSGEEFSLLTHPPGHLKAGRNTWVTDYSIVQQGLFFHLEINKSYNVVELDLEELF